MAYTNMPWQERLKKVEEETYRSGKSSVYDSEMKRAQQVLEQRKAQGLDTSAQERYIQQLKTASATGQAKLSAYMSGADPSNVDPNYIKSLATGTPYNPVLPVNYEKSSKSSAPSVYSDTAGTMESYQPSTPGNIGYQRPPDYTDMIKKGFEERRKALLSQIDQALSKNLSGYAGMADQAQSMYRQALSQSDVERARAIQRILEATEASGGYRGGQNISGQIAANTMAQQTAGQLQQNLAQQLQEIARAQQLLKEQAEQQKVQAQAATSAEEIDALVRAQQAAEQLALQQQQQALEWAKFDASKEWQDFQKQFQLDEQAWSRNENNPQVRAQILQNEITRLKLLNLPRELQLEVQRLEQELAQGRVSMEEARARIQNMQTQANLEQQRIDLSKQQYQQGLYNNYVSQIDNSPYVTRDDYGNMQVTNPTALRNYIISLNLSDELTDQLLLRYGLPTN